jgi:outer membrane receptor protein involved in Fe transport
MSFLNFSRFLYICLTWFYLLLISTYTFGQENTTTVISGKIITQEGDGAESTTVSLLNARDSSLVKSSIADKTGKYIFSRIAAGRYIISSVKSGYVIAYSKLFSVGLAGKNIEVENIRLAATVKELAGVTVTARRPLFETKDDKTIFNVSEDASLNGQMAIDALQKAPFISVDGNGNVMLNGKTNFQIHLNGRNTGIFAINPKEALQSFPANLIERIEISTTPSAKYDGEGASGIINIITRKKITGYNGSVSAMQNSIGGTSGNMNMNIKKGRAGFTFFGSLSRNYIDQFGYTDYLSTIPSAAFAKRFSDNQINSKTVNRYLNTEFSYEIDSLNALSAYANLRKNDRTNKGKNFITQYDQAGAVLLSSIYQSLNESIIPAGDWGIDYIRKYKSSKEKELSIKFNELYGNNRTYSNNDQYNSNNINRFLINDNVTKNVQRTIQFDFILPLPKNRKLELGAKAILRTAESEYQSLLKDMSDNQYKTDLNNSNLFNYRQDIYSIYSVYGFKIKTISVNAGARLEQTTVHGNFLTSGTVAEQHYLNLLPGISISKNLNKGQRLTFAYGKKLARPGINFLNPFVSNQDPLNISYGNKDLGPELIHNFEFRYGIFQKGTSINLTLSESIGTKSIEAYAFLNPATGVTTSTYNNIGQNYTTSLNGFLSTPLTTKIRMNINLNLSYRILHNILDKAVGNRGMGGYWYGDITYTPSRRFTANILGGMNFPTIQLQGNSGLSYYYTLAPSYKMAKEKLLLTVYLRAFLQRHLPNKSVLQSPDFYQETMLNSPGRTLWVSLRYFFGKLKENVSRKKGVTVDDEKQVPQNN